MGPEDTKDLLARLRSSKGKGDNSDSLTRAISLLEPVLKEGTESVDVLSSLLTEVLKPLFASTSNPNLTPAGRKNLVSAPPNTGRFNTPFLETERKQWKQASWSVDVLRYIVVQFDAQPASSRQEVVEKQFYLLVPPVLTLIDDGDISCKTSGCELLVGLCDAISTCKSIILSRSGLADVFADSLKANFMLLPTLTPESESLKLLRQLYPAFRALVSATYPSEPPSIPIKNYHGGPTLLKSSVAGRKQSYPHRDPRQQMLDTILRHGILASYNHASDHVAIAEFLIHEAALVISDMRINAVKYLSRLLPLLRSILTNPLGAAYPPLIEAACDLLSMLITTCKPRIASTWWVECMRMCVGCWIIVRMDLPGSTPVQTKLVIVVQSLRDVVGDEKFREAADTLITEDEELKDLLYPD
jgi:tRNA nucleotidyltransferase (CCA-adding enzyme)